MAARLRIPKAPLPFPGQPWVDPSLVALARSQTPGPHPIGAVIAEFEVDGEPVPWRTPTQGKHVSYTPKNVVAWKQAVAVAAHQQGFGEAAGVPAYPFPVMMNFWFCRKCPKSRKPGDWWGTRPDCDNLQKSQADCLSGNVFKTSLPKLDDAGLPVFDPVTGKALKVSSRFCPPQPTGRVIADDNQVVQVEAHKIYWSRSLLRVQVLALPDRCPGPFPFAP